MDKKEVVVGKVDASYIERYEKIKVEHDAMHDAIKDEIKAFIDKKAEEHKPMCNVNKRREQDLFKEILIAGGIPESEHEKEYSVNKDTGEICRIDMQIDPRLKEAFEQGEKTFKN
jgi:hypothetical protein